MLEGSLGCLHSHLFYALYMDSPYAKLGVSSVHKAFHGKIGGAATQNDDQCLLHLPTYLKQIGPVACGSRAREFSGWHLKK